MTLIELQKQNIEMARSNGRREMLNKIAGFLTDEGRADLALKLYEKFTQDTTVSEVCND